MKKLIITLMVLILVIYNASAQAKAVKNPLQNTNPEAQITVFLDKFNKCSTEHNIDCLKGLYSQNYVSGDGLKYDDFLKLVQETWTDYPDIKYTADVQTIRVNNNFAFVESKDTTTAQTAKPSNVTGDKGCLDSISHTLTYLQRYGKDWKIISDKILYEKTIIKYGKAKQVSIDFIAPEQVYSGEDYTASLYLDVPDNVVAIGAIAREPIVYPQIKPDEIFRQISPETGVLERVMKANTTNNNELASASVGFTELTEDLSRKAYIKLSGLALVLTRVNVIPKSTFVAPKEQPKEYTEETDEESLPEQNSDE